MPAERIKGGSHQPCIGICEDRPARFVYAEDYERLEQFVRTLASVTPRKGEWEQSYRALQQRARHLLAQAL